MCYFAVKTKFTYNFRSHKSNKNTVCLLDCAESQIVLSYAFVIIQ